jgi:hypothetical protein
VNVVAQKSVCLRIGWQVKITTDDISSVEENIGHSCGSGSMRGLWVPVYSSDAVVKRNAPPRRNRCAGSVTRNSSRCATFVAMVQTTHLWEGDNGACRGWLYGRVTWVSCLNLASWSGTRERRGKSPGGGCSDSAPRRQILKAGPQTMTTKSNLTTATLREELLETMEKLRTNKISLKEAKAKTAAASKELRQLRARLQGTAQ